MRMTEAIRIRRERVTQMLSMGVKSTQQIANELGLSYDTVNNDIRWIKAQTKHWIYGMAREGYAHDCHMAILAIERYERDMENELAEAMKDPKAIGLRIALRKTLVEFKIGRLNIEGEGPTLMAVRNVIKGEFKSDAEMTPKERKLYGAN